MAPGLSSRVPLPVAEGVPVVAHPGRLPLGELPQARVVAVVHEVAYRVGAGLVRAGVPALRAAAGLLPLIRGVLHVVARVGAAVLEGVEQAEPVAGLVGGGVAEVEALPAAAGHRPVVDDHPV